MSNKSSFGDLFNKFRLKSGFDTYAKLGKALAEEGYIYEDSTFSKWKNGERAPKDRSVLIALIKIFLTNGGINTSNEAISLLHAVGLKGLDTEELDQLKLTSGNAKNPYSYYRPITQPNSLYQDLEITNDNLRVVNLNNLSIEYLKEYWMHQFQSGLAEFYSYVSGNANPPEYFYELIRSDVYDNNPHTTIFVVIAVDKSTGLEYLVSGVRFIVSQTSSKSTLPFMNCYDPANAWPHKNTDAIAELDQFILPNWAMKWRVNIVRIGLGFVKEYALQKNVRTVYAMLTQPLVDLSRESGVKCVEVQDTVSTYLNNSDTSKLANTEAYGFSIIWGQNPKLYMLEM